MRGGVRVAGRVALKTVSWLRPLRETDSVLATPSSARGAAPFAAVMESWLVPRRKTGRERWIWAKPISGTTTLVYRGVLRSLRRSSLRRRSCRCGVAQRRCQMDRLPARLEKRDDPVRAVLPRTFQYRNLILNLPHTQNSGSLRERSTGVSSQKSASASAGPLINRCPSYARGLRCFTS